MAEEKDKNTFEIIIALVIVVASFMYSYDALVTEVRIDVLLAMLLFGAGIIYLFSNVWNR